MATQLKCDECSEIFEVSNEIADATYRWRGVSGDPYICETCAGVAEIISSPAMEKDDAR